MVAVVRAYVAVVRHSGHRERNGARVRASVSACGRGPSEWHSLETAWCAWWPWCAYTRATAAPRGARGSVPLGIHWEKLYRHESKGPADFRHVGRV